MLSIRGILSIFVLASIFFSSSSNPGLAYSMEPTATSTSDGRPDDAFVPQNTTATAYCGNNRVEHPEQCDEGLNNGTRDCSCSISCQLTATSNSGYTMYPESTEY